MTKQEFERDYPGNGIDAFDEREYYPPICDCGENIEMDENYYELNTLFGGNLILCEECYKELKEEYDENK